MEWPVRIGKMEQIIYIVKSYAFRLNAGCPGKFGEAQNHLNKLRAICICNLLNFDYLTQPLFFFFFFLKKLPLCFIISKTCKQWLVLQNLGCNAYTLDYFLKYFLSLFNNWTTLQYLYYFLKLYYFLVNLAPLRNNL